METTTAITIAATNNELYHHGILGMKWGIRRYQPYPKGYHGSGKEIGDAARARNPSNDGSGSTRRLSRKQKRALQKQEAEQRKMTKEEIDQAIRRAVQSGKASEVLKYKDHMTTQQLQDAAMRIQWEKKLSDYSKQEISTNRQKIDKIMKEIGRTTGYAETGLKAYKTAQEIMKEVEKAKLQAKARAKARTH